MTRSQEDVNEILLPGWQQRRKDAGRSVDAACVRWPARASRLRLFGPTR